MNIAITSPTSYTDSYDFPFYDESKKPRQQEIDRAERGDAALPLYFPTKPVLDKPKSPEIAFIKLIGEIHETQTALMSSMAEEIESKNDEMILQNKERHAALVEAAKEAASAGWWGNVMDLASMVLAAGSLVVGASIVGTGSGAIIGGALITSGLLSLTNVALQKTGAWEWIATQIAQKQEQKELLAWLLPATLTVASMIAGGGSAMMLIQTSGLVSVTKEGIAIGNATIKMIEGVAGFSSKRSAANLSYAQGKSEERKMQMELTSDQITQIQNQVESHLKTHKHALKTGESLVQMTKEVATILGKIK